MIAAMAFLAASALAAPIELNQLTMENPPAWLKPALVKKAVDRAERVLEWDIRKIRVFWHPNAAEFENLHHFGPTVLAITRPQDQSVHLGPRITATNFEWVFGHELAHVIVLQKYKAAIPRWLEEGLANYVGRATQAIDYAWLARQPYRPVEGLVHAFSGTADAARYHYQASAAAIELIRSKCELPELLQLSVGKDLRAYLKTLCEIPDFDVALKAYIQRKSR